jgi:hypothetical protein
MAPEVFHALPVPDTTGLGRDPIPFHGNHVYANRQLVVKH